MQAVDYRTAAARAMSEDDLTEQVRDIAATLRMQRFHTYDSRRSPAGWVDEVLIGRRVLFRELKDETGKVTPAQRECMAGLAAAGLDVDVWRPSDLLSGRVLAEMQAAA